MNRTDLIKSLNLEGIGLEVGVYQGDLSHFILNETKLYLYLVDAWKYFETGYVDTCNADNEQQLRRLTTTVAKLRKFEGRYTLIKDLSVNASKLFSDNFFDFIYIDANHSYQGAKEDIDAWYPKVKKGGILSGHDYLNKSASYEVKKAVDKFAEKNNFKVETTTSDGPYFTWYIRIP